MILQRLIEYGDSSEEDAVPKMYAPRPVKWLIDVNSDGTFRGFTSLQEETEKKKKSRGKTMVLPHISKTSGISSKLLSENCEYALGLISEKKIKEAEKKGDKRAREKAVKKAEERHKAFIELTEHCHAETGESSVKSVLDFLKRYDVKDLKIPDEMIAEDDIVFRVDKSIFPSDLDKVKKYWADNALSGSGKKEKATEQSCILCGEEKPVISPHPILIKNIPGGQTSGLAIISANSDAFESFGMKKSLVAPTCADCAEKYAKTLNGLIASRENTIVTGKIRYVFWTRSGFSPIAYYLDKPDPVEVKKLISSAGSGDKRDLSIDDEEFYSCALSASGARVVFRDWLETTVGNVKKNLINWFRLQAIVDPWNEDKPYSLRDLAKSLFFRKKQKEDDMRITPEVPKALLSCALKGTPLPLSLIFLAIKRNHADQGITRPRAALIKMVLLTHIYKDQKEDFMTKLEPGLKNTAYLCGRLLAELEALQKAALGDIKSTLTDRYFGTASSAPASVFGRLIRGAQPHLAKLRKKENQGAYIAIEKRLEEIMSGIDSFPKTLSMKDQGLFSLGYFHQKARSRADKKHFADKKKENNSDDENGGN